MTALVLTFSLLACGDSDSEPDPRAAEPERPSFPVATEKPAGLIWDAQVPNRTFRQISSLLPPSMAMLANVSPAEAIEALTDVPVRAIIDPATPVVLAGVGVTEADDLVAFRVAQEPTVPAGSQMTPGPFGGKWVPLAIEQDPPRWGLLVDKVLVIGPNQQVIESAAPYLASQLAEASELTSVHAHLTGDGVTRLRSFLNEVRENQAASLRREALAERERHDDEPDLGEPEALLDWGEPKLAEFIGLLEGVDHVDLQLSLEGAVTLTAQAHVRDGSDLESELGAASTFSLEPSAAERLFTLLRKDGPEEEMWLGEFLENVAGDRIPEREREQLVELETAIHAARFAEGNHPLEAVLAGTCSGGGFGVWTTSTQTPVAAELAARPLSSGHLRHVFARGLDCDPSRTRPARNATQVELCERTSWWVSATEDRLTYGVFRGEEVACKGAADEAIASATSVDESGSSILEAQLSVSELLSLIGRGRGTAGQNLNLRVEREDGDANVTLAIPQAAMQQALQMAIPMLLR